MLGHGNQEMSSNTQVFWGTNINANDVQTKLKNFINTFVELNDNDEDENDDQFTKAPFYFGKLTLLRQMEETVLEVNCDHIFQFDQALYRQLENHPINVIPMFDLVVSQIYKEMYLYSHIGMAGGDQNAAMEGDDEATDPVMIQVRPFNLRKVYRIREMDPTHIEKLITLRGIVIRCSDVIPEMKEASFTCSGCGQEENRFLEKGRI